MMYFGSHRDLPYKLDAHAKELYQLSGMIERLTKADVAKAAKSLEEAARALEDLMKGELPGCTCRLVENDNYSYLDWNENCRHHRGLWLFQSESKKKYDEALKKLKNELRVKLVAELIGGLARGDGQGAKHLVARAIELADETIAQLGGV